MAFVAYFSLSSCISFSAFFYVNTEPTFYFQWESIYVVVSTYFLYDWEDVVAFKTYVLLLWIAKNKRVK